jgi:hypothetical protein
MASVSEATKGMARHAKDAASDRTNAYAPAQLKRPCGPAPVSRSWKRSSRSYVAQRDRSAVRAARTAAVTAFDQMRALALTRATHAAMRIDTAAARLVVHAGRDTVVRVEMFRAWGVRLAATRDSTAIAPDGLGYGAANLRLILSRGAAADSIIVSRLGRVTTR